MSSSNYIASSDPVVQSYNYLYQRAYYAWNPFYPLAAMDLRYYLGDQWDNQEKEKLFAENRNAYVFNLIRRNINLIDGYQRKHRLSPVAVPQEDADQKAADQATKLLLYAFNKGDGYHHISNSFSGGLKTGFNLLTMWKDFREDPVNGDICFGREPYSGFITDPYFTKLDFSDCSYVIRRKYLSAEHAASLLPGQEDEVYELHRMGWSRDDKFVWLPYQRQPNGQELMAYNEFYQQKWKKVPMLVDEVTGSYMEWEGSNEALKFLMQKYPQLKKVMKPKRYIECSIILNDQRMRTEENQFGINEYPFVPFMGLFEPESEFWELKAQSLVRCMIDPQKEANRRRSQMVDILDSQVNSGWIAEADSVVNPQSLFQTSQGKVIWRKKGTDGKVLERLQGANIPAGMFELQKQFDADIMNILGVNDASFGETDNGQESGVMFMLRQGAAVVNLQSLFDNLRYAQKIAAKKCLGMMQDWTPQKMQRILNEEPDPKLLDGDLLKFDISIQEGLLSDAQKQIYFRQLVDLKQLGVPVSGQMLAEAAPIQGKSEFNKQIAEAEKQQQQAAQQQQQIQMQLIQSELEGNKAKAIADVNLGKERFSRGLANLGLEDNRAAEAVDHRAGAALDRAKAIKELSSMDDDKLIKYFNLIAMMEEKSRRDEDEVKSDDVAISEQGANPQAQNLPQGPGASGELEQPSEV